MTAQTATSTDQAAEDLVIAAYRYLVAAGRSMGPSVLIADLRDALPLLTRDEQDAAFLRLRLSDRVEVSFQDTEIRAERTNPRIVAAALQMGGERKDTMTIWE